MAATSDAVPPMSAPTSADIALKMAGSTCISVPKRMAQKRFRSMRRNHCERKIDERRPKDLPDRVPPATGSRRVDWCERGHQTNAPGFVSPSFVQYCSDVRFWPTADMPK